MGRAADAPRRLLPYRRSMTTTTSTLFRAATGLLLVGSLAWLMKVAVIGVAESDEGAFVSILWLVGFFGMLLGAALLAAWITRSRHLVLRVLAAFGGLVVFFVSMDMLDTLAKAVTDGAGPSYLEEEWGILLAALVWLGVALLAGARQRSLPVVARRSPSA